MKPESPPSSSYAASSKDAFHADVVQSVHQAVSDNPVVVVGMGWNPHVRRACSALDAAGVEYTYLGFGNYLSGWKPRLAIKIWSGWPPFRKSSSTAACSAAPTRSSKHWRTDPRACGHPSQRRPAH